MRSILLLLAILLPLLQASAQQGPLEADRPDQTETPAIVPAGWYQFEGGYARECAGRGSAIAEAAPTVLSKVGLAPWAELRLITERTAMHRSDVNGSMTAGLLPVEVGAKVRLLEEHQWRPNTSLIGHLGLPATASPAFRPRTVFGNFRFTLAHSLSDHFSLGYNLGADWDGERPTATGIYTLTVAVAVTPRLGAFIEAYGFVNDVDAADHRSDGGLTYRLGPDVLLDASSGFSMVEQRWFVNLGLSFRVPVFAARAAPAQ